MKIIEESVTQETINNYKDELFLLNEGIEELKDKKILKIYSDEGQLVGISMYSYLDKDDVELFLSAEQEKFKGKLCNSLYLDSIYALQRGYNVTNSVITYLKNKCGDMWLYSHIQAMKFWNHRKDMQYIGENIFITC